MAQLQKTAKTPFPFLDLPPEIREKIYALICHDPENPISITINDPINSTTFDRVVQRYTPSDPSDFYPDDLLLANSQIYHEIRPLFFNLNTFHLILVRLREYTGVFYDDSFLDNRLEIRSLVIDIRRWYYASRLFELLEQMILQGKLRTLEVLIREGGALRNLTNALGGNYGGGSKFRTLSRILRDPDLKKVSLWAGGFDQPWTDCTHLI